MRRGDGSYRHIHQGRADSGEAGREEGHVRHGQQPDKERSGGIRGGWWVSGVWRSIRINLNKKVRTPILRLKPATPIVDSTPAGNLTMIQEAPCA